MSDMMDSNDKMISAEEEQERLGQRLRNSREYVGLSQEFVADRLSIPRASISAIETGKRKVSSLELKQFARLYRCSISSLLGEEEDMPEDATARALFRMTRELNEQDRQEVLRFAQFLRQDRHAKQAHEEKSSLDAHDDTMKRS